MDDQPQSLKSVFAIAESARDTLNSIPDSLQTALDSYTTASQLVSQLSLFSPNETLDDIPTSSLPYLLIPLHIADLTQLLPASSPPDRLALLARARTHYESFLSRLDSYALLPPDEAKLYTLYTESPATFSTTGPLSGGDPAAKRNAKIANLRRSQAQRAKLDALLRDPRYAAFEDDEHRDDEAVRAVYTAQIESAAHAALQSLEGIAREEDVLKQAPVPLMAGTSGWGSPSQDDERARRASVTRDGSERVELVRLRSALGGQGPLLDKGGKPLQPFTIVGGAGDRAERARGVFRPGHNLPTMSIEEYLAEERRRGGIIEGGGEASWRAGEKNGEDEDDMDKADEETMKARAWDEFTESNPRGAGNTLNRG